MANFEDELTQALFGGGGQAASYEPQFDPQAGKVALLRARRELDGLPPPTQRAALDFYNRVLEDDAAVIPDGLDFDLATRMRTAAAEFAPAYRGHKAWESMANEVRQKESERLRAQREIEDRAASGAYGYTPEDYFLPEGSPRVDWQGGRDFMNTYLAGAPSAIGEAVRDPSLANVTNAGMRTGLAVASAVPGVGPLARYGIMGAAGAGAAGYGEALRRDLSGSGEAHAQGAGRDLGQMVAGDPELEALHVELRRLEQEGQSPVAGRSRQESDLIRSEKRQQAATVRSQIMERLAQKSQSAEGARQAQYNAKVDTATRMRNEELGRQRRFSDTEVGKVYDKTGGYAPFLAGAVGGALTKSAGKGLIRDSVAPSVAGGLAGFTAINAPVGYEAFFSPTVNPERRAYEVYARELPDGHPDKAKAEAYAQTQPERNPVQKLAEEAFYDPWKASKRGAWGVIEGVGGGVIGHHMTRVPGRIMDAVAEVPGRMREAYIRGQTGADQAATIRNAYRGGGAGSPPPSTSAVDPAPPVAGPAAGAQGRPSSLTPTPEPSLPTPGSSGAASTSSAPSYARYGDPNSGSPYRAISEEYVKAELLKPRAAPKSASDIAFDLADRYKTAGLRPISPDELRARAQETIVKLDIMRDALGKRRAQISNKSQVDNVLKVVTGQPHTLAIPLAVGSGLAAGAIPSDADASEGHWNYQKRKPTGEFTKGFLGEYSRQRGDD